ncbi:MAG: hypothetical protein LBT04_06610 [Prevotellaceae bacterium]|jgi:outer membrane protein assembly factor BamD (BamD/ComL family)|nr:hypothetical protein [Prevotellaceae bacterium]
MKKLSLLITIVFSTHCAWAQVCNELLKDGIAKYNAGKYAEAKTYFNKGLSQKCDNANFQEWIEKCNKMIGKSLLTSSLFFI